MTTRVEEESSILKIKTNKSLPYTSVGENNNTRNDKEWAVVDQETLKMMNKFTTANGKQQRRCHLSIPEKQKVLTRVTSSIIKVLIFETQQLVSPLFK